MSTRGSVVHDLVDLGDDDAALEGGGLDDGRRVLGVRPGVEIALARRPPAPRPARRAASGRRSSGRTARGRCGSRRSRSCPLATSWARRAACGPEKEKSSRARDAALEQVQVLGQRQHRLHHVQVVHLRPGSSRARLRPGSRPASGCCPRGRRGRPARSRLRAARRCGRPEPGLPAAKLAAARQAPGPAACAGCPSGRGMAGAFMVLLGSFAADAEHRVRQPGGDAREEAEQQHRERPSGRRRASRPR